MQPFKASRHEASRNATPDISPDLLSRVRHQHRTVVQQVLWILFALIALTILINIIIFGTQGSSLQGSAPNIVLCAIVGVALWLNHRGRMRQALGLVITVIIFAACLPLLIYGIRGTQASWFVFFIPVVLAAFLLSRRALFLTGGISLLTLFLGYILERSGNLLVEAPLGTPDPVLLALQAGIVLTIVIFFLDRFGLSLYRALITAAEREVSLTREIAERRQAEERLGMALSAAKMATYDMSLANDEVYGSKNLEALYGLPYTGKPRPVQDYLDCMHPEDRERALETRNAQDALMEHQDEYRVIHEDKSTGWLATVNKTVPAENGEPDHIAGVVIDITEMKSMQRALQEMNQTLEKRVDGRTTELQAAYKELEMFSYTVSHDLRAPLRAIDGFSKVLLDDYAGVLDDTGQRYLQRVVAGAGRMGELIDDLLNFAHISQVSLHRKKVDLGLLAHEVISGLQADQPERQVGIKIGSNLKALADPRLTAVVLNNLLGNAWKFTKGREKACIEFGSLEGEEGTFYVKDNGAGFDMAYAGKLFQPFQRLHDHSKFEGTGIGLATVQRVVERHGGRIWAEASVDRGAAFYFTLTRESTAPQNELS